MTCNVTFALRPVEAREKDLLDDLLQPYLAELSAFSDDLTDVNGRFEYPYLEHYWRDPSRFAFFIESGQGVCGFSLVRTLLDPENNQHCMELAEIYVSPWCREKGAATGIVMELFRRWPGPWQVGVLPRNQSAYRFWQNVLKKADSDLIETWPSAGEGGYILFRLTPAETLFV